MKSLFIYITSCGFGAKSQLSQFDSSVSYVACLHSNAVTHQSQLCNDWPITISVLINDWLVWHHKYLCNIHDLIDFYIIHHMPISTRLTLFIVSIGGTNRQNSKLWHTSMKRAILRRKILTGLFLICQLLQQSCHLYFFIILSSYRPYNLRPYHNYYGGKFLI